MQSKINFYQTRSIGEIINTSVEFIKQNFSALLKSILFIAGPAIFLISIGYGFFQTTMMETMASFKKNQDPTVMLAYSKKILGYTSWGALFFVVAFLFLTLVVYEYIRTYNDRKEVETISVKEIWSLVARDSWIAIKTILGFIIVMFGIMIILMLGMMVIGGLAGVTGILAAAVGGATGTVMASIIAFAMFFLVFFFMISMLSPLTLLFNVRIIERKKFFNSVARCYNLASGYRWKIIGLILICMVIQISVSFIFQLPHLLINSYSLITLEVSDYSIAFIIFNTIGLLLSFVLHVFFMININFLYFSIVENRESIGMMQKIDSIGTAPKIESVDEETY